VIIILLLSYSSRVGLYLLQQRHPAIDGVQGDWQAAGVLTVHAGGHLNEVSVFKRI
jgi:hypothetical protein